MTVSDWLKASAEQLGKVGIKSARLDCLILLEDQLSISRAKLIAESQTINLSESDLVILETNLLRRLSHEPLAYIRGWVEFYGYKFQVNKNVLVPRPESESFINLLKKFNFTDSDKLLDIGGGSGVLGITSKLVFPALKVDLIEISLSAIEVMKTNAKILGADVGIINSDLLGSNNQAYRFVIANLPYVPIDYKINQDASFEPKLAIFAGEGGLELYKKLVDQISKLDVRPEFLLFESLPSQHEAMKDLLISISYKLYDSEGLVQVFVNLKS